ncbi:MAG: biopolymer transporter TolR [Sphingobacteriales bacterium]|nr:MAG: biopolymer transporter TolR [Sphingobacteriales bacterium]
MTKKLTYILTAFAFFASAINAAAQPRPAGIFDDHTQVGNKRSVANLMYDPEYQTYGINAAGKNIWATEDDFHFAWKKLTGDFILRANANFFGDSKQLHRKLGWMVRSSLAGNSAHVSAVVHGGDGLTSLQYRKVTGDSTKEIKAAISFASVIQLERKGDTYTVSVARDGETFTAVEVSNIDLGDEVYAGLFVCSHDEKVRETALFTNVRIIRPAASDPVNSKKYIGSQIELLTIDGGNSRVVYQSPKSLQAPNWMKDSKSLIYNSEGLLYNFNLKTHTQVQINTGSYTDNNNDHVISFDGKMLVISDHSKSFHESLGYVVPVTGGEPKRITEKGSSYMHGWSPDGKYVVYAGERDHEFDVYRVAVAGGPEERLTTAPGLDDGPEYTPDGKYIWFNSVRTGNMQIWRMKADGTEQTQMTDDKDLYNWFPHISPDGKWVVFLSFMKNEVKPSEHSFYKRVYLKLMPAAGGPSKVIAYVYGGQGTINTPSWSPDSKRIAFISNNQLIYPVFPVSK